MNVLLVTVDSLRADHVGPQDGGPSLTPNIDRMAQDGVTFAHACSPSSYTWGVFASIFLSAYPSTVTNRRGVLNTERLTMAELFRQNGYATAGINSNPFISTGFGYARGFDLFDDGLFVKGARLPRRIYPLVAKAQRLTMRQAYLPACQVNQKAENWLEWVSKDRRPFFLWLHYMDVHGPYQSKRGLAYLNKLRAEFLWRKAVATPHKITPREHLELLHCYAEEIVYTDRHIGFMLDLLSRHGLYEDTTVILCADHGDEFREHGRYSHWRQLHDELIRVPLIIRHPKGKRGLKVDVPVGLVDILPTMVYMLGFRADSGQFVGESLWPVVRDGDSTRLRGYVIGDAAPDRDETILGIRNDRWKLIIDGANGGPELYDLQSDPDERINVLAHFPQVAHELEARIESEISRHGVGPARESAEPIWNAAEEREVLARLQALGYVDWVEEHEQLKANP